MDFFSMSPFVSFIRRNKYLICTGGQSYPSTGSTGDGYRFLRNWGILSLRYRPL
jgi:predicted flavoprotein YhiN